MYPRAEVRLRGRTTLEYWRRQLELRWLARFGRTRWPSVPVPVRDQPHVGIVVVSYNTRALTAHLIFSLYRLLGSSEFQCLVVVDNASTDGSADLLRKLHEADLIHLIQNTTQRYHAPALNQGISWLAKQQRRVGADARLDYIWVLDSDVVVLRSDTVKDATAVFARSQPALVGQSVGDPEDIRPSGEPSLSTCSMMLDPGRIWKPPFPPFTNDGAPWVSMQVFAERHGLGLALHPFTEDGYLLHLGRGTLRAIAEAEDTANAFYAWAVDHTEHHFGGMADGAEVYGRFLELFEREVGALTSENLIAACSRSTDTAPVRPTGSANAPSHS